MATIGVTPPAITVPAPAVLSHAAVSLTRSLWTRCMTQFPAASIRLPEIAFSSQPISISGTDDSRRSV